MSHIDYSSDILKHFVRRNGWLPACKEQSHTIRNRSQKIPLRYFTFCATQAIDVYMLEREGILRRSTQTGRLEGVYFCEKDPEDFGKIANLIGSPDQGFLGDFEKIVLFEDDEDTRGIELYPEVKEEETEEVEEEADRAYPEHVRRKLRYKDAHQRLHKAFPFDILNLDILGVMFPPRRGVITPLLKSLIRILEWQAQSLFPNNRPCQQFTLFLTSHIDPDNTDAEAIQQLARRFSENIDTNIEFRSAFVNLYGYQDTSEFLKDKFAEFFCLAFPKYIIHQALFHLGWEIVPGPVFLYNRDYRREVGRHYQIMHSVSIYKRIPNFGQRLDGLEISKYTNMVTQLVINGVNWIDDAMKEPDIKQALEEDLSNIVKFRDQPRGL